MHEQNEALHEMQRAAPAGGLLQWYTQGARSAALMPARWQGLNASPATIATLTVVSIVVQQALERLYIEGPARFYWQSGYCTPG